MNEDVIDVLENIIISNIEPTSDAIMDGYMCETMGSFYYYFETTIGAWYNFRWENRNDRIHFLKINKDFKTTIRDVWKIHDDDIIRFILEKCI